MLELSPVSCFFSVKGIVKKRPRCCPSPSFNPNNIKAFHKIITPKALLAVSDSGEDLFEGADSQKAGNALTARLSASLRCLKQARGTLQTMMKLNTPRISLQTPTASSDL